MSTSVQPKSGVVVGKPRVDPGDYARRKAEQVQRAKELREQRSSGNLSEEHTFKPKVNKKQSPTEINPAEGDTLDKFYQEEVKRLPTPRRNDDYMTGSQMADPGPDSLAHEVKRTTGRNIPEQPLSARSNSSSHSQQSSSSQHSRGSSSAAVAPDSYTRRGEQGSSGSAHDRRNSNQGQNGVQHRNSNNENPGDGRRRDSLRLLKTKIASRRSSSRGSISASGDDFYTSDNNGTSSFQGNDEYAASSDAHQYRSVEPYERQHVESSVRQNIKVVVSPKRSKAPTTFSPTNSHEGSNQNPATSQPVTVQPPRQQGSNRPQPVQAKAQAPQPPKAAVAAAGTSECTRTSGCQCRDCSAASVALTAPAVTAVYAEPQEGEVEEVGPKVQCPDCGRSFIEEVFPKHERVCKKVFLSKRKPVDMADKRVGELKQENPGVATSKASSQSKKTQSDAIKADKKAKWKEQSSAFRNMLKQSKDVTVALKEGKELPPVVPSAPDPSLIPCPNCGRRFNEKAAERHMPKCADIKAKPTSLKKGAGKGLGAAARAAEKKKR